MLPNSLSSLTYQDVFRLLRQRQLGNSSQSSNSNSNDKNKSTSPSSNSRPSEQTTGTTTSNANLVQQLQALMLLGLLNRSANAENEPPKSLISPNILSSSQNKLNAKSASDSNLITKDSRGPQSLTKSGAKLPKIDIDDLTMTPNLDESEGSQANPSESQLFDPKSKKIRKTNTCGHPERAHYAKNMCNQCYHKHGRTKKPWKCNHEKLYAHGLCQNCYINAYNKKRSQKVKDEKAETPKSENTESKLGSLPSPSLKDSLIMEDKTAFGDEDNPNATHQNSPKIESEDDQKPQEKEAPREENPQEDQNKEDSTAMEVEEKHNQGE